jgi:altronate dehydratase large subunit
MPGYLRENGEVGIRDHLLALPSVVCSNRAALEAGRAVGGVSIEHPLGCAQIGADKDQTWRTLVGVGAHPNVRHTVVIGLGCEGVQASTIHQGILDRGRAADVFSIQSAGGTDQASSLAEDVLQNHQPQPVDQVPISASKLLLGVADLKPLGERGEAIVQAFLAAGGRVLRAMTLSHSAPSDHVVNYAEPVPGEGNLW